VKSKTYTQNKQPSDKTQISKFCQLGVKRTRFQNRKKKGNDFFDRRTTVNIINQRACYSFFVYEHADITDRLLVLFNALNGFVANLHWYFKYLSTFDFCSLKVPKLTDRCWLCLFSEIEVFHLPPVLATCTQFKAAQLSHDMSYYH